MKKYLSDNISPNLLEAFKKSKNKVTRFYENEEQKQPVNNLLTNPDVVKVLKKILADRSEYGSDWEYLTPNVVADVGKEIGATKLSYNEVAKIAEDPDGLIDSLGLQSEDIMSMQEIPALDIQPFSSTEDLEDLDRLDNNDDLVTMDELEKTETVKESGVNSGNAPNNIFQASMVEDEKNVVLADALYQLARQLEDNVITPQDVKNRIDRFVMRESVDVHIFDPGDFNKAVEILQKNSRVDYINEFGNTIKLSGLNDKVLENEIKVTLEKIGMLDGLDYDISQKVNENMIKVHSNKRRSKLAESIQVRYSPAHDGLILNNKILVRDDDEQFIFSPVRAPSTILDDDRVAVNLGITDDQMDELIEILNDVAVDQGGTLDFSRADGMNIELMESKYKRRSKLAESDSMYQKSTHVTDDYLGGNGAVSPSVVNDDNPETDTPSTLEYRDGEKGDLVVEEDEIMGDIEAINTEIDNDFPASDVIVTKITDQDELAEINTRISDVHSDEPAQDLSVYEINGSIVDNKPVILVVDNDLDADDGVIITGSVEQSGDVDIQELSNIVRSALNKAGLSIIDEEQPFGESESQSERADVDRYEYEQGKIDGMHDEKMSEEDEESAEPVTDVTKTISIEEGPNSIFVKGDVRDILCALTDETSCEEILADTGGQKGEEELMASIATESLLNKIRMRCRE